MCISCGNALRSVYGMNANLSPYVGFWKRFGAAFLDGIIVLIVSFIIGISVGIISVFLPSLYSELAFNLLGLVIAVLYYAGFESSSYQGTPGKQIIGIKVTDLEGNRISFGKALVRYVVKVITGIILIGYLTIIFSEKKQGLYDMAAGTVVVEK
jgi:uncharacterized RDD family membrane protein YckC